MKWIIGFILMLFMSESLFAKNYVTSSKGKKYYTGLVIPKTFSPPVVRSALSELKAAGIGLPETYDLKTLYSLDNAEDQGSCGSCWAFSITGVFKDVLKINNVQRRLSQQYLLDCNSHGHSCQGGFFESWDLHQTPRGGVNWSEYQYTGSQGSCKGNLKYNEQIAGWAYTPGGENPSVDEIKAAIYKYGTVAVGVAADQAMSNYTGGIFQGSGATQLNHAVNLVGWGNGFWILKNSWGTQWGENGGYMRIKFGANGVGAWTNYAIYGSGPSPDPTPTPTPTPDPTPGPTPTPTPTPPPPPCQPQPVAKTGYASEITIRQGSSLMMGTRAISGTQYTWTAQPPFNGNATPREAIIKYTPTSNKLLTIYANNKCGTAQASTKVNVLSLDKRKLNKNTKEVETSADPTPVKECTATSKCTCKCTDKVCPPCPEPNPNPLGETMKTNGRFLYDACGKKMILRGVNQMTCYTDWVGTPRDGLPMFSEIAKTGANAVRITWRMDLGKDVTISQLDAAITNAVANKLIPIVSIFDKTCLWSEKDINDVLTWWQQPEVVSLILKHKKYLILNFANEMGTWETTPIQYVTEYKKVLRSLRYTGITVPIMIDAGKCGQDEEIIISAGQELIKADPEHNVLFGLHIWWTDQNADRITKAIKSINDLKIPFMISEFAERSTDCKTPILYKEIVKEAQANEIGYMPWSWDHENACIEHAMTKNKEQTFDTLWGWGKEVMDSIQKTSIKSTCF